MTSQLEAFLSYYIPDLDLNPLLEKFSEKKIKKSQLLLKPGMKCNYLAFIQEGVFKVYYFDLNGKEIVTWFSYSDMVITDLLGFYTSGVARFYVEAMEDSLLYKISRENLASIYSKRPVYRKFGQLFAEEALTMLMQRTMSLHTKSAEERYKELLQVPELMHKIPLKYLASYLGITDTSLSRIRKNIR